MTAAPMTAEREREIRNTWLYDGCDAWPEDVADISDLLAELDRVRTERDEARRLLPDVEPDRDELVALAEQCCDEYHGEGGTFQDFRGTASLGRAHWVRFACYLWTLGARPRPATTEILAGAPRPDTSARVRELRELLLTTWARMSDDAEDIATLYDTGIELADIAEGK